MKAALNEIFDDHAGADLDFIHIYKGGPSQKYKVVWPTITFAQQHTFWTRWNYSCGSGPTIKAWEEAFKAPDAIWPNGQLREIATVTQGDIDYTGKPAWRVAFMWANNIRNAVNGWNITQDAFYPPDENDNIDLFASGTIAPFHTATDRSAASEHFNSACVYGFGECLLSPTLAYEIFHCMDLSVAAPNDEAGQARWLKNQWVKVSTSSASVRARITDVSGCNKVELSRGVVRALGELEDATDVLDVTISDP